MIAVQFMVLGTLEVSSPGSVTAPMLRILLATLLTRPNHAVPVDVLIDAAWQGKPVPKARQKLQVHVHRLRQALGDPGRIRRDHSTYTLMVLPGELDAERFETLLDSGADAALRQDWEASAILVRQALDLWRGEPYGDLDRVPLLHAEADRLTERRLAGFEDLYAAELACGRHHAVVAGLRDLAERHPLRERLQELLMLALYRGGRQAEALEVYRRARSRLVEELGVEPGPRLVALQAAVLATDPLLEVVAGGPAQLPAAVADFTGRDKQLDLIRDLVRDHPGTTPVLSIAGAAGIGKTALAVRAAHELKHDYPGGQLYVDLRGADDSPLEPADVLARFLRALGVTGPAIPDDAGERAALYRSRLAGARVLVLLDNAVGEEQVRPLLPGAAGCLVLVTSRTRVAGLEGSHLVDLELFDTDHAIDLLARVAGRSRVAAEPVAAEEIVRLCGRLPLAVRIAAARLVARPHWRLGQLAARLADEHHRLDELRLGDLEVRASLALSDRDLDPVTRKAFHRLGLLDAPRFPAWVAAAVLDRPASDGELIVDLLTDAQLLEPAGTDGYRFHDLVRLYARERAQSEPVAARSAAIARAIHGWLTLATTATTTHPPPPPSAASRAAAPLPSPPTGPSDAAPPPPPTPPTGPSDAATPPLPSPPSGAPGGATPPPPSPPSGASLPGVGWWVEGVGVGDGAGWLETERAALVCAVDQAVAIGQEPVAWELAGTLTSFLDIRGYFDDWRRTHETGLAAARRLGDDRFAGAMLVALARLELINDRFDQTWVLLEQAEQAFREAGDRHGLADVTYHAGATLRSLGRPDDARTRLGQALASFRELGDLRREAQVRQEIAAAYLDDRRPDEARPHLEFALDTFRTVGDRRNEALALRWLGGIDRGDHAFDRAEDRLLRSREIFEELADLHNAAYVVGDLGKVRLDQERWTDAEALIERSLESLRAFGDRHGEARSLHDLGLIRQFTGDYDRAVDRFSEALRLWQELGVSLYQERTRRSLEECLKATVK